MCLQVILEHAPQLATRHLFVTIMKVQKESLSKHFIIQYPAWQGKNIYLCSGNTGIYVYDYALCEKIRSTT